MKPSFELTPQQHMFDNTLESVTELYPKAQEFISAVKEHVDQWLAENTEKRTS